MQFRILGPLEIATDDDSTVAVPQGRHREILATLLLHPNQPVTAATLIRVLWGDVPSLAAATTLRSHISTLRQLSPHFRRLETHRSGYLLRVTERELDVAEFRRCGADGWAAAQSGDQARAIPLLRRALDVWREPPLADVPSDPQLEEMAADLAGERRVTTQRWVEARLLLGEHEELIPEIRRLVGDDAFNEHLWAQLALALYRSGRQADAIDVFGKIRHLLASECGLDPGRELADLQRRMLARDPSLDMPARLLAPGTPRPWPDEIAPIATAARPDLAQSVVTPAVDDLSGVGATMARLEDELIGSAPPVHSVVITGPAGCGKTSFAAKLASRLGADHPGGVFFVAVAGSGPCPLPLADALEALLVAAGVSELAIPDTVTERARLFRTRIADRRIMMVIDDPVDATLPHLVTPVAAGSTIVVTSRGDVLPAPTSTVRLTGLADGAVRDTICAGVAGSTRRQDLAERVVLLAAIAGNLPGSIDLVLRAVDARPDWSTSEIARAADCVPHLDGASSAVTLAVAALGSRFRNAFYALASVTSGDVRSWTISAVAGTVDVDDLASVLLERGLLACRTEARTGAVHYWIPDHIAVPVRAAAAAEPGLDLFSARRRVLTAWLELADLADRAVPRPLGGLPTRRIARRTVLSEAGAVDLVRDAVQWFAQESSSLWSAVRDAIAFGDTVVAESLVAYQAAYRYYTHDLDAVLALWHELRALAAGVGDVDGVARIDIQIAGVLFQQGNACQAREVVRLAFGRLEAAGDSRTLALALYLLGHDAMTNGQLHDALRCARLGHSLARHVRDDAAQLLNVAVLAEIHLELGDSRMGHLRSGQALTLAQRLDEATYMSLATTLLARVVAS